MGTLIPNTGPRIFRGGLTKRHIEDYIKIDEDNIHQGILKRGNMKYCRGNGECLYGIGLYVKYFRSQDYDILYAVENSLGFHYSWKDETATSPSGYYYHDYNDAGQVGRYPCVHVTPRITQRGAVDEEELDNDT